MANEHPSGLPHAYQRANGDPAVQAVVHHGREPYMQATDSHDIQEIQRRRTERIGRLIAKDGDRKRGADAIVLPDAGQVAFTPGEIFVAGDVFPVPAGTIDDVPMTGRVALGVRVVRSWITSEDDPSLMGLVPGSDAEGEGGSAREIVTLHWAMEGDGGEGDFYGVYLLDNGTILDQTPPPLLDGMIQALAAYDRVHGPYIVTGCRVAALGKQGGSQIFSIEEGEANIDGFKRTRYTATRHAEPEEWDVGAVAGETHSYPGGATAVITLRRTPIAGIAQVLLDKQRTVTVVRGSTANGADNLPDASIISVSEVKQGGTTYVVGSDYNLVGNTIDWAPAGAEPGVATSYDVTYIYRDAVTPANVTDTSIEVSGGVAAGQVIVTYTHKLPRIDLLCLDRLGAAVYIKGISARTNPVRPVPPRNILPLAEIRNDWFGTPQVLVDGIHTGPWMPPVQEMWRYFRQVENNNRLLQLERLKSNVDARDPAAKRNMFVDPFVDDNFRDLGEEQSGAIGAGFLQLAIEPTFFDTSLNEPVTLDYVAEVIVEQSLRTGCERINPYQNFTQMPGALTLTPAVDFWTEAQTTWASPSTVEFNRGVTFNGPTEQVSVNNEMVSTRTEALPFLRQRTVGFRIAGFSEGEILEELTFDGIDVTPGGVPAADEAGEIAGSFTIPPNVTAGTKLVRAVSVAGKRAEATYTGQGTLNIETMRQVTTINRWTMWVPPASESEGDGIGWESSDPQAQIFNLNRPRQLIGVDFHLCAIGDVANHILVHQVSVENGFPTVDVMAEAFVSMIGAVEGWKEARYQLPVTVVPARDHAFVIKTDDGEHAVSLAGLGGFDAALQQYVTAHPYPIGPRLSSVNARTWTAHQDEALAFRLVAARYTETTKVVDLGTVDLVDASDLQIRATFDRPSPECSVIFEIERPGGEIYRLAAFQVLQLGEFITETVEVRAVLTGTETLSPILYAPVLVVAGKIATEATYVTRVINITDADRVSAYLKASLPAGSTLTVEYDHADDDWAEITGPTTEISPNPAWVELNYRQGSLADTQLRLKLTLSGGPAARPLVSDFGLGVM